jgi:tRNA 2-thiouridine synthesizing protein C
LANTVPNPLFVFTQAPLHPQAREGAEALLACAAFDQQPTALFVHQGVYQLLPQGDVAGSKNLNKMLQALELYGVESIYACQDSISLRGLTEGQLNINSQLIDKNTMSQLIQQASWVVRF